MSKVSQLLLLHVVTILALSLCVWTIRGNFSRLTYRARRKVAWLFLPGRLATEESWIRQQRFICYFGLLLLAIVYTAVLYRILSK